MTEMTELQKKGLEAVAELKGLAAELFPLAAGPYMVYVKKRARQYHNSRLALAFVQCQITRLERQKLNGGIVT